MSKRIYPSGSTKRKKAAEEKEKLRKLPRLTSFFSRASVQEQITSHDISSLDIHGIEDRVDHSVPETKREEKASVQPSEKIPENKQCSSNDPADWGKLNEEDRNFWIHKGPEFFHNRKRDFSETARKYQDANGKTTVRHLTESAFIRKLKNGEHVNRSWLLYSPSKKSLYCFPCCLFPSSNFSFNSADGFSDWKNSCRAISEHENSVGHRNASMAYVTRSKNAGHVDQQIVSNYNNEVNYWKNILKRIVETIKFLASRGLAFRGQNEIIGSQLNGNYLGCLELISKFDPFLMEHLTKHGNPGKGNTSYLSANICNEFIDIMGKQVKREIIAELKASKYYSISVDSTPDCSHTDQLTFTVRYVKNYLPVERFLEFIPINEHRSEYLTDTVIAFLNDNHISINDCRGQTYDNASNMAGIYSGLQARVKEKCEFATFIPCAAHSLNLVGINAVGCVTDATSFFQLVQKLYTFFSSSPSRWQILKESLGQHKVIKYPSDTRWSAHADAVNALEKGYEKILLALECIEEDEKKTPETRNEACSIKKKMLKLENIVLTQMWSIILSRFNETSKTLQKETISLDVIPKLMTSLSNFLRDMRNNFDHLENAARKRFPNSNYCQSRTRKRSSRVTFFDGAAEEVTFQGKEQFRIRTFIPIIDTLTNQLESRAKSYTLVNDKFRFLSRIKSIKEDELYESCFNFSKFYYSDVQEDDLKQECLQLKHYLCAEDSTNDDIPLADIYRLLKTNQVEDMFPNVEIALRIFLSMMITNCTGERSFSKLNLIKNELKSNMLQGRLNSLSLLNIEYDILQQITFDDVINDFAQQKVRRKALMNV